jgi:hypothetical protein
VLYKQRDHFKGWRPRYFRLSEGVLQYYLDAQDPTPKGTVLVDRCVVEPASEGKKVAGVKAVPGSASSKEKQEYFPLVISHPETSKTYNLAATSEKGRLGWIEALRFAAGAQTTRSGSIDPTSPSAASLSPPSSAPTSDSVAAAAAAALSSSPRSGVNGVGEGSGGGGGSEQGAVGVHPEVWARVGPCVGALLKMCDENPADPESGWQSFGEKFEVKGYKRPGRWD